MEYKGRNLENIANEDPLRTRLRDYLKDHLETSLGEYPRFGPLADLYKHMGRFGYDQYEIGAAILHERGDLPHKE